MPRNRLIGVFGTCGQVPAVIADESGQCQLVQSHTSYAENAPWRLWPGAIPVPGSVFVSCGAIFSHCLLPNAAFQAAAPAFALSI
jgi:hypothetical protein